MSEKKKKGVAETAVLVVASVFFVACDKLANGGKKAK